MRVDTPHSLCPGLCPLLYPPSSLYPDQMVAQTGTLSSPHRLAILNSQSYTNSHPHDARRGPHQQESHLGSAEGAGSRSLLAHVSGPHDAPIIPYHVVLSSPAFSDPQRHLKTKVYSPLFCQTSVALATSIIKPPRWSSPVYHPAPPSFFSLPFH